MESRRNCAVDMCVEIAGIAMKNPVMVASGTFGFGEEYSKFYDINRLGAVVTKGITLLPRTGNPPPRLYETPAGLLNSVGLENPGVERFIADEWPRLKKLTVPVIANIDGDTVDEYREIAKRLSDLNGLAALEVNISCPNVEKGGMAFGQDPDSAFEVVRAVKEATGLPVIAKLSPNVMNIKKIASAVEAAGADAISLINTVLGMAIDINRRQPVFHRTFAGLSGPAVKPIALRMVWEVYEAVKIPIIGMGGIFTWRDAAEFILAGASAVAVGTAGLVDPEAPLKIIDGLEKYLVDCSACESALKTSGDDNIIKLRDIVGLAHK
ncbi:dihydroorotate dehydrogenase [Thermoanaerobacterium sp. DL9XJH110]|uniref:dihydroorotate dehydrogenase n=1 Tax=Thermoanaerobacterium sp. DL9XJH110 TaxID=3386643 RepID=UPI003BB59A00